MLQYSDWNSLTSAAQEKCGRVLVEHVAPVAEKIVKKHIASDIYSVYTPISGGWVNGATYQRRHVLENNMYHSLNNASDELLVTSNATASKSVVKGFSFHNRRPGAFLKLLETGNMGIWRNGFPRPAIGNAQAEIDKSSAISQAIRAGLNQIFNV